MITNSVFTPADILLPCHADMEKWAVIACDQFSSEPEYWDRVAKTARGTASAYHLMLPEAYLEKADMDVEAARIAAAMGAYLASDIFYTLPNSFIYVERRLRGGKTRRGLIGKLDLDAYDFTAGTRAPVRASEHTDVLRLPPRIRMREGACLEMPHIMLLTDDPGDIVFSALDAAKGEMQVLYDFDLMENGGHITGYQCRGELCSSAIPAADGVEMIVGDGNHSLAAAKAVWETVKGDLSPSEREGHPMRYALAELTNVYDPSLEIEPIHRVVFTDNPGTLMAKFKNFRNVHDTAGARIGALQSFLEDYISTNGGRIDYIHGEDALQNLSKEPDAACFQMDAVEKADLFKTVRAGGVFPKKSFSMGHAEDKRYYLECRAL